MTQKDIEWISNYNSHNLYLCSQSECDLIDNSTLARPRRVRVQAISVRSADDHYRCHQNLARESFLLVCIS